MAKRGVRQRSDDVNPLTRLPRSCSSMSGEGESWVEGDTKEFRVILLRNDCAVEIDWRQATKLPVPRGEQGHRRLGRRQRETVLLGLRGKFGRKRREILGDVIRLDVLDRTVEVIGIVFVDGRRGLDVVDEVVEEQRREDTALRNPHLDLLPLALFPPVQNPDLPVTKVGYKPPL